MRILSPASDVPTSTPLRHDAKETDSTASSEATNIVVTSTIPTVVLDTNVVSDNMAARLCTSLLGHVLFLKNQVPFPVVQLARMPTSDNTTRAAKKRLELLNSFDTLASHLYTTFIALSTALALRGTPEKAQVGTETIPLCRGESGVARAFFAVALGPSVGTAKSRVIVGIDGLETKVWGLQEDNPWNEAVTIPEEDDESASDTDEDEDEESENENGESEGRSDDEDASVSDDDASPPLSRSPSPAPSSDTESSASTPPEDPETIRAAERLLSRTLASACAEDDGQGLAAEMAPTQIHVLLRAPRRFDHPSWIPRQNLCSSLNNFLSDFLVESGQKPAFCGTTNKRAKANKVQGVWLKSRESTTYSEDSEDNLAEEDELIWWSWDGKLTGFTDW